MPATPFLGREQELAEVVELLAADDTRLLTLTGPGGTGKTRLALQAAGLASDAYPDGVCWIPLAPLRDPALVLATAAQTLGSKNGLAEHIADKTMLCLFDNFEQVVDAGPELAGLLAECPNLRRPRHEQGAPARLRASRPTPSRRSPSQTARRSSRRVPARSILPSPRARRCRELCLRLDELPLALELAAARTALFSPEQISSKLSQRLDLLKGARDADPRQQTLRATIEWSYDLLSDDEQRLFRRARRLLAAAAPTRPPRRSPSADPDTLQSLLDKSLVRKRDSRSARYWMLETIREYAHGQLEESGEAERLARWHLAHYAALAEDVDARSKVGEYELGRLEEERDNLRSAFDTALALEPEQALDLAGRLALYWNPRGHWFEGRQRLAAALAAAPAAPPSARVRALNEAGYLAFWQTDLGDAEQLGREALALAREHGDRSGSGYALNLLGGIVGVGDPIAAIEYYEESLAEYEAAGDEAGRRGLLQDLASNAVGRGDYQRAISLLRDKIASTGSRDTYSLALAVGLLGFALAGNGENEEARQSFEQSLEMCRADGFSRLEAEILSGLADLMRTAHPAQALEYYRESMELARTIDYLPFVHYCLWRIAEIALAGGNAKNAATLLGVVAEFVERIGGLFNPEEEEQFDAAIRDARVALGNDFDAVWAEGGGLSLDQAVDLSLTVTAPGR